MGSRPVPGSLSSEVLPLHQQITLLIMPLQPLIQPEFPVVARKHRLTHPPHMGIEVRWMHSEPRFPLCKQGASSSSYLLETSCSS